MLVLLFIGFWIYREGTFSKQILKLEILGPDSAKVGEEIEYTIKYKNNGNFTLENPTLTIDLPDNSITDDGKVIVTKELEDIYPGTENSVVAKARLVGKEGDIKTAKAYLSYKPKNLTVRYESDTTFSTKIDEVPITLEFDVSSKAEKGKDFQYILNYFSNIDYTIGSLIIKIVPVSGFEIKSASPTSLDNQEWKLNSLAKNEGGRISVDGKISSDAADSLTFAAQLGVKQNGNFVVIKEATAQVQTIQAMLYISQQINGMSNYVASPGETLHYQIFFRNIGTSAFEKLYMIANLNGDALDMSTIKSNSGQVQQSGNMIVWDWKDVSQLEKVDVQEESSVDFSVKVKDDWVPSASGSGDAVIEDQINISQITKRFSIKVSSGLIISQTASFDSENETGYPAVGKDNVYTIGWNITNYSGDMKNVKIKAVLPSTVNLTGKILPTTESSNFTFDSASREVVWSVGDVASGMGVSGDPLGIYFQVFLAPLSSQKGSAAQLVGQATISGENQFTDSVATSSDAAVDTTLGNTISGVVQ